MTESKYKKTENETGRSMIEMLGVLAIIGVLSVGGIAGYSKAMHRYRLNKTIEQITQIAGNVRAFFAPQKSYEGLCSWCNDTKALLKKAKLVPEDSNSTYTLNISATKKIHSDSCSSDPLCNNQAFMIRMNKVTEEDCIDLITYDWSSVGVGVIDIVNNQSNFAINASIIPPAGIDHAVQICDVPPDDTNNIDYIYINFDVDASTGIWKHYIDATNTLLNGN